MNRTTGIRLACVAALVGGCHTDPFVPAFPYGTSFYGASGPLNAGPEERLTFADANEDGEAFRAWAPTWASDGSGILYAFSPRPYGPGEAKGALRCILNIPCRAVAADPGDTCLAMLPPTGGSAYWNVCESRSGHSFVTDVIGPGNISHSGQLLYVESSGTASPQFTAFPPPPPAGEYADLWLATPQAPLVRQDLCRFFADTDAVLPPAPSCVVNSLSEIQWSGANTFTAIAGSGLVQGTITAAGATIAGVDTRSDAVAYALVGGGGTAMFVGSDLSVRRVTIPGGVLTVVATMPLSASGHLLDIGCHLDLCIVLASDGLPVHWDLWKVDLATGASSVVRTFTHELKTAKLSPISGDVVALEGVNVFLLTGVVP